MARQDSTATATEQFPPEDRDACSENTKPSGEKLGGGTEGQKPAARSWRFWLVFLSVCLCAFTASIEATVTATALPNIVGAIGGSSQYVWIANSFMIAATAIQPLAGQVSNIIGRRWPMIESTALLLLGSGIAGGANGVAMLIAGRTVMGLGAGGIYVLMDTIVCDLVTERERSAYLGLMLSTTAFGMALGPLIGGSLGQASWRWVFYLNLPLAGFALVVMLLVLRLKYPASQDTKQALLRIDFPGNAILIPSVTAVLLGLIFGGTVFPWKSWHVILPIVLGGLGLIAFMLYEGSRFCKEPSVPHRLFTNRTSIFGFVQGFCGALALTWVLYFLPVYFQTLKKLSPFRAAVDILPFTAFMVPASMVAGGIMSKTGIYIPLQAAGFAALALGQGLFSTLDAESSTAKWVIFQLITAGGLGFVVTTVLPGIQASLPESDVATSTGTYQFVRTFAFTWGISVPGIVFNNRINQLLYLIDDPDVRAQLADGRAYAAATQGLLTEIQGTSNSQVLQVYTGALKTVWEVAVAFALLGFLAALASKHIPLRTENQTEYGMEEKPASEKETMVEKGV